MTKKVNLLLLILSLFVFQACATKKSEPALPQNQASPNLVLQEPESVSPPSSVPADHSYDDWDDDWDDDWEEDLDTNSQPDKIEGLNRAVFSFNDGFISYIFKPIDTVYSGLFPSYMRRGFGNFYRNLGYPVRLINSLLQFKFDKVGKETASFIMNTTFGVGGLFHITHDMPQLQSSPEDFGQTLSFYGLGHGSYVVLPLIGPSSVRDAVGLVADAVVHPLFWIHPESVQYSMAGHDMTNTMSRHLPTYEAIKEESFDHYSSMKDIYFQHRKSLEEK